MAILVHTVTADFTWKQIESFCKSKDAASFLSVGDIITIKLKNDIQAEIAVAGIHTYSDSEVVFTFKDILPFTYYMNKEDTNKGGYDASEMAQFLDTEVFALLPDDLQDVIKKRCGHKLWLHPGFEVFGPGPSDVFSAEAVNTEHLPYYQNMRNRIKRKNGDITCWWLASADKYSGPPVGISESWICGPRNDTLCFHVASPYSNAVWTFKASKFFGISPGFCI